MVGTSWKLAHLVGWHIVFHVQTRVERCTIYWEPPADNNSTLKELVNDEKSFSDKLSQNIFFFLQPTCMEQRYSCSFILKHVAFLFLLLRRDSKVLENLSNIVSKITVTYRFLPQTIAKQCNEQQVHFPLQCAQVFAPNFCLFIYAIKWQKAKSSLLLAEPSRKVTT